MYDQYFVVKFESDTAGIKYLDELRCNEYKDKGFKYVLDCSKESLITIHESKVLKNETIYYVLNPPEETNFNDIKNISKSCHKQRVLHLVITGDSKLVQFGNVIKDIDLRDFTHKAEKIQQSQEYSFYNDLLIINDFINFAFTLPNGVNFKSLQNIRDKILNSVKSKIAVLERAHIILKKEVANKGIEVVNYDAENVNERFFSIKDQEYKKQISVLRNLKFSLVQNSKNKEEIRLKILKLFEDNYTENIKHILHSPLKTILKTLKL